MDRLSMERGKMADKLGGVVTRFSLLMVKKSMVKTMGKMMVKTIGKTTMEINLMKAIFDYI